MHFAKTLPAFLPGKGFKGLITFTGEEGLKLAQSHQPKAIILDINLPGIDGWTVLESLKENRRPDISLSTSCPADDPVPAAFAKGAVGY